MASQLRIEVVRFFLLVSSATAAVPAASITGCSAGVEGAGHSEATAAQVSEDTRCSEELEASNPLLYRVTKQRAVPDPWAPLSLVGTDAGRDFSLHLHPSALANFEIHSAAAEHLQALLQAADAYYAAGNVDVPLQLWSGHRSFAEQTAMERDDNLLTTARAGHSEHHLGTAVDFATEASHEHALLAYTSGDPTSATWQAPTQAEIVWLGWLNANAHHYGFVNSYPFSSLHASDWRRFDQLAIDTKLNADIQSSVRTVDITGYAVEPWHWRYVGPELATAFYDLKTLNDVNYTLEELLQLEADLNCSPPPSASPVPTETPVADDVEDPNAAFPAGETQVCSLEGLAARECAQCVIARRSACVDRCFDNARCESACYDAAQFEALACR